MEDKNQSKKNSKGTINWFTLVGVMIVVFVLGLLASRITQRRGEYVNLRPQMPISLFEPRPEVWGKNFPREYETYLQTRDMTFKSMFNGNAMIDELARDPRLVVLWAGYPFSKDYNQSRGHAYAVDDIRNSLRTGTPKDENDGPMPNTCWTCKSPDVPRLMNDLGVENFYKGKWASRGHEVVNFISCSDCHDPKDMSLRITRPALVEAFARQGKDISKATHNEKRSLVCAQCHVEYYFKGDGKYLTFPWDKGTSAEAMLKYYDEPNFNGAQFKDWEHGLSKAPMLKAQHPDYEVFMEGIHAQRGLSCADCHMPYKTEGGVKFTNHKIQSPLNNIANSCQVCHRESEETLRDNVYSRQMKVKELQDRSEQLLVSAHVEAKAAWDGGAQADDMKEALQLIRHSQWKWDYAVAGHGSSFHAPLESARVFGQSIDNAHQARAALVKVLNKYNVKQPVPYPEIDTKDKAQKFIGLDMQKLTKEKEEWKQKTLPQWDEKAKAREAQYK